MEVILGSFKKRKNSTKNNFTGHSVEGNAVLPLNIYNPMIKLNKSVWDSSYNYFKVPEFNRFYFISDVTYYAGFVEIKGECDALASFKDEIGATSDYVLRSASDNNGGIIDSLYPTKAKPQLSVNGNRLFSDNDLQNGAFIVSVINSFGQTGAITYYMMTESDFINFAHTVLDEVSWWTPSQTSISEGALKFLKMVFNPIDYVTKCLYIPGFAILRDQLHPVFTTLNIGHWPNIQGDTADYLALKDKYTIRKAYVFNVAPHPLAVQRGGYLNAAPYRKITVNIEPFGKIEIDGALLNEDGDLDFMMEVDVTTGNAIFRFLSGGVLLGVLSGNIALEMPITQYTVNYRSSNQAVVSGIKSALNFDVIGAAVGVNNAIAERLPTVSYKSDYSGFLSLSHEVTYTTTYEIPVDDDITDNGRPLMQQRQMSSLSGYIRTEQGTFKSNKALSLEIDSVNDFMKGGFYYE